MIKKSRSNSGLQLQGTLIIPNRSDSWTMILYPWVISDVKLLDRALDMVASIVPFSAAI
ncbi:MAG: hypothetical protein WA941_12035 [Nitrososphaeraceae archaeon]